MAPIVTPKKNEKTSKAQHPFSSKGYAKEEISCQRQASIQAKYPPKKAQSKPVKEPTTVMIDDVSEAPKTSMK